MSASLHIPLAIRAKSDAELSKKLLQVQAKEGGKVYIINILQDVKTSEWVCWYYPIRYHGGGLL